MSNSRKWTFRTAAVLLGLSTFPIMEGVCRVAGWGADAGLQSHVAEFTSGRPLFALNESGDQFEVAANRRQYFAAESFPTRKADGEFRIFVLGGSTVQGRPFSIPTSFTTFWEMSLETANPNVAWEVVNCGGISYASYRLKPILSECLLYQPDLILICTGHNEYLEFVTYADTRNSPVVSGMYSTLSRFQSFRLADRGLRYVFSKPVDQPPRFVPGQEVDAVLDHQGGLDAYQRSRIDEGRIATGFRDNIIGMIEMCRDADVPLILMRPPSNLGDCPPFKSEFSDNVDESTRLELISSLVSASKQMETDRAEAMSTLEQVTIRDPHYAIGWYLYGRAMMQAGRIEEGVSALVRARDEDICPLRMKSKLESILREVADQESVVLFDAHQFLAADARHGVVGDAQLVDHVHPSFRSHQLLGLEMTKLMIGEGMLEVERAGWGHAAQLIFDSHLQSLDDIYFLRGRQMLGVLKAWAAGRADGPPLTDVPKGRSVN